MMKFKKFLAAAMTGAMMFGMVATATPVTNVYAVEDDSTQETAKVISVSIEKSFENSFVAPGSQKDYSAYLKWDKYPAGTDKIEWDVAGGTSEDTKIEIVKRDPNDESGEKARLTVGADETAGKLTITAVSEKTPSIKDSYEVLVGKGVRLSIDYESMYGEILTNGNDSFVFLEVLKDETGSKPGTVYCYEIPEEEDYVWVDLSSLKLSKDVYLRVYGDKNTTPLETSYKIEQQPKKPSVKYVAGKNTIKDSFTLKSGDLKDLECKGIFDSEWQSFAVSEEEEGLTKDDLDELTVMGATLLVRQKATKTAPPSAETKVKIKAGPKAPKVTLDYAKNTIKLPKDSVIQVPKGTMTATGSAIENFSFSFKVTDLTIAPATLADKLVAEFVTQYDADRENSEKLTETDKASLLASITDGYSILVRTSNTKGTSQPAFVTVKAAPSITTVSGSAIGTGTISVMTEKNGATVPSTTDNLSYEYGEKGLKLKPNGSAYTFSYSVDGGKKYKKITNETTVPYKNISTNVLVRTEGTKENKNKGIIANWASNGEAVAVNPAKIVIRGDTSITNTASGTSKTYTAVVKDDLGKYVTGKEIEWKVTGANATFANGTLTLTKDCSGEITLTATCKDNANIKGELKITVTAASAN